MKTSESVTVPSVRMGLLAVCLVIASHLGIAQAQGSTPAGAISEARAAVSEAWEVYHRAALSGTLQSPAIQINIERDLRTARALLAEIETTTAAADVGTSDRLDQIRLLTDRIITQSHWRKQ